MRIYEGLQGIMLPCNTEKEPLKTEDVQQIQMIAGCNSECSFIFKSFILHC